MSLVKKQTIYLFSSMCSDSMLLKALIATRPETSDLPEIPFAYSERIACDKPIIVIKKPSYYLEENYPIVPGRKAKFIILIRNPFDAIYISSSI